MCVSIWFGDKSNAMANNHVPRVRTELHMRRQLLSAAQLNEGEPDE